MTEITQDAAYCIEYFYAKLECRDALSTALLALSKRSQKEPGCLQYDVLVDQENTNLFILILKFINSDAMKKHENQPYIKQFAEHDMIKLCTEVKWHDAKKIAPIIEEIDKY